MTIAGIDRGLSEEALRRMEIGQIVDLVVEWNEMHDTEKKAGGSGGREATQADWDAFWG